MEKLSDNLSLDVLASLNAIDEELDQLENQSQSESQTSPPVAKASKRRNSSTNKQSDGVNQEAGPTKRRRRLGMSGPAALHATEQEPPVQEPPEGPTVPPVQEPPVQEPGPPVPPVQEPPVQEPGPPVPPVQGPPEEELRNQLTVLLKTFSKAQLSQLMKNLGLRYGQGGTTVARMITEIVTTPVPVKYYSNKELQLMYLARTKVRLGNLKTQSLIDSMRRILPGFDGIKRPAMDGLEWLFFVRAMADFQRSSSDVMEDKFQYLYLAWKSDKESFDLTIANKRVEILNRWIMLQLLPQFRYYLSTTDIAIHREEMDSLNAQPVSQ